MKILKLLLALAAVVVIPAVLAPFIYSIVQDKYPFERVLSRLIMISGFVAIALFIRKDLGAFRRFGFTADTNWWRLIGIGILLGSGILFGMAIFESFFGVYDIGLRVKWDRIPERVFKALGTGLLVATLEEFFFRGFVFLSLCKFMHRAWSFIITNAFYAIVHFFRGSKQEWVEPTISDSFSVLLSWLKPLGDWQNILPSFVGLLLFGFVLQYAYLRTRALYLAIGIHAGAVMFLKVDVNFIAEKNPDPTLFWGGGEYYGGLMGWGFMILMGAFVWFVSREKQVKA